MATVMVLKSVRDGMSLIRRLSIRSMITNLILGEPVTVVDPNGAEWVCYDDDRFTPYDAAIAGCVLANIASFPDFNPLQVSNVRAEVVRYCEAHGLVWPVPGIDDSANPYQFAYSAQGGPAAIRIELGPIWSSV